MAESPTATRLWADVSPDKPVHIKFDSKSAGNRRPPDIVLGPNEHARKLMEVYRQQSIKNKNKRHKQKRDNVIDVETCSVRSQPPKSWLPELTLLDVDKKSLLSPVGWVTNSIIIDAVQRLLQQQFPHIKGFQSVNLGLVYNFEIIKGEFIQILHSLGYYIYHWLSTSSSCSI